MDKEEEYHDPDYPGALVTVKEEPITLSDEDKNEKIVKIIRREFGQELEVRKQEILLLDQRMSTARRLLHRLRCALVNGYYTEQRLMLTGTAIQEEVAAQSEPRAKAEVATILREPQRRLHPSVRKLLGKQSVDIDEIFRHRTPRNRSRVDYSAMVQSRNYTIPADTTKSLRPEPKEEIMEPEVRPKKVPRHLAPKITNVVSLDDPTRNKMKKRYRLIIGNTSKYSPGAGWGDRSTHVWLLYVRAAPPAPPHPAPLLRALTLTLHASYAPHHTATVTSPPFHISRRGWGEFPARVELHFQLPELNRPAAITHTITLDRHYTGLQTLGSETVVDVWLYSTPEMLPFEYKDDIIDNPSIKEEPPEPETKQTVVDTLTESLNTITDNKDADSWLDFFSKPTELDVDQMLIKQVKTEEVKDLECDIDASFIDRNVTNNVDGYEIVSNEKADWNLQYKIENPPEDLPIEILSQPTSPKKRIMKYIDPTTGKIYYLELDRTLDLTKVQEIVINSKGSIKTAKISPIKSNGLKNVRKPKRGGVSLLKPEVKSLLKTEETSADDFKVKVDDLKVKADLSHIENDHCYLGTSWVNDTIKTEKTVLPVMEVKKSSVASVKNKHDKSLYSVLCSHVTCFTCVRVAVNYLLKKIPLISDKASDPDFLKDFPFVVETEERFWKYDFAKRRNIEWSRAKLINRILNEHLQTEETIWRTKQILTFSRLHAYYPIRPEAKHMMETLQPKDWGSWDNFDKKDSNIKQVYPNAADINTLTLFSDESKNLLLSETLDLTDSDEEIDVVADAGVKVKREVVSECEGELTVMPVESDDDRLSFMFLEKKCSDIGIELRNEDVGNGYSYSAVHAVLLSAMRSFAEELVRSAASHRLREEARGVWLGSSTSPALICLAHTLPATSSPRLQLLTQRCLGDKR